MKEDNDSNGIVILMMVAFMLAALYMGQAIVGMG